MASQRESPDAETLATAALNAASVDEGLQLIVSAPSGVFLVPLSKKTFVVLGRSRDADVCIDDPSVSRRHAALEIAERVTVVDLGSRHGTRVAGRAVAEDEPIALPIGSAFELGNVSVLLGRKPEARKDGARPPQLRESVVVRDPALEELWDLLEVVGPSHLNVLILGETGTGKEVFAEAVVAASQRSEAPFVKINCAALSSTLLESELFGHERGAFTGADRPKRGLIEEADGGTLFLDEVGELPLDLQAKLLRVIEAGELMRVGSVKPRSVDVRYVSATNVGLEEAVDAKTFRADLLFRLNGFTLRLPPLRDRPADIIPLAEHFVARGAERLQAPAPTLGESAKATLRGYAFPGNVRELKTLIERAMAFARGAAEITSEHLAPALKPEKASSQEAAAPSPDETLRESVASVERERILDALRTTGGNQTEAAKVLGVSRRTLINKIEQYGIPRPRKREG